MVTIAQTIAHSKKYKLSAFKKLKPSNGIRSKTIAPIIPINKAKICRDVIGVLKKVQIKNRS